MRNEIPHERINQKGRPFQVWELKMDGEKILAWIECPSCRREVHKFSHFDEEEEILCSCGVTFRLKINIDNS
jgi:hypothetical protein